LNFDLNFWHLVIIQAAWLTFQGLSYLLIQKNARPAHDMERSFDKKIPLVPQSVFIYVLWFPLIALYPIGLYYCSPECWLAYMISVAIDVAVSLVIYRVYPTTFDRPKLKNETFSEKCLSLMYKVDYKGLNCMPSMHCSVSFLIIFSALACGAMAGWIQAGVCLLALGIVVSTVLTKQHVIVDVLSALALAIICFLC